MEATVVLKERGENDIRTKLPTPDDVRAQRQENRVQQLLVKKQLLLAEQQRRKGERKEAKVASASVEDNAGANVVGGKAEIGGGGREVHVSEYGVRGREEGASIGSGVQDGGGSVVGVDGAKGGMGAGAKAAGSKVALP